jgi:hypothetical protein
VGDLDASTKALGKKAWKATVAVSVHDEAENPLANASVSGSWSSGNPLGEASCITDRNGQCSVTSPKLPSSTSSVTFSVDNVTHATVSSYDTAANHDPDGDSDGTSITVSAP